MGTLAIQLELHSLFITHSQSTFTYLLLFLIDQLIIWLIVGWLVGWLIEYICGKAFISSVCSFYHQLCKNCIENSEIQTSHT